MICIQNIIYCLASVEKAKGEVYKHFLMHSNNFTLTGPDFSLIVAQMSRRNGLMQLVE